MKLIFKSDRKGHRLNGLLEDTADLHIVSGAGGTWRSGKGDVHTECSSLELEPEL